MKYVLDACALLALLKDEDGANVVDNLLAEAAGTGYSVCMNKYTLLRRNDRFIRSSRNGCG